MLSIVTAPNAVLSQKSKNISVPTGQLDTETKILIEEMKKTLATTRDPEGIGLAAPQVGKSLRLFIVKESINAATTVYINPQMQLLSGRKPTKKQEKAAEKKLEGCLSLPRIWGPVKRAPKVAILYIDETGTEKKELVTGFKATILQHEFDHLEGILFPKRVLEQQGKLYKSSKDEKGTDVFEEIEL